uniref:Uncharacterized protein C8orf74-like protein n=1 Tax=Magallana gigas TaxID=29159 RepID=K1R521_MAGGI
MAVTLSDLVVKSISNLPKNEGKAFLASQLKLTCLEDDDNLRNAIYVDFLYDNLMFAVEKGFTWRQVCTVVTFCDGILKDSKDKDITDALQFLKLQSFELADVLGQRNFPIYTDFVFQTYLRHFKLFKYVFTQERDILKPTVSLRVETPADPGSMKQSKPELVWEYEKQYESIQREEAEHANKRLEEKAKTLETAEKQAKERLNFPIYTDFVFQTYLRHFKLFKYVFTQERDILKPTVSLRVETPADPGSMKQSKPELVWEYEKQYESIQREEAEHANKRLEEKAKTLETAEKQAKERLEKISGVQEPLSKEKVGELIQEIIGSYSSLVVEKVKCNIADVQEDLEFKLARTSLPRPQALGPPPRFNLKPKTPVPTPKKTPPKSPKSERKKSGNSRSKSRNK